ncbi:YfhO family protein [Puia dinghuensis]|uniref:Membrane protein n=1 Tax=Puia dinghuensis TaxID=1792502 RepID=A0A8J2UBJ3_9BACT|nr:YfhO family protein [Puia dinghuensis]GGA93960.1 membrane protein [Puia dinghuensis]
MQKSWYRPFIPHAIAIGVFLLVAVVYCKPIFEHKTLSPDDTAGWKAMAQNSFQYKEIHGRFPLWTENLFCGMPAYQIAMDTPAFSPQYLIYNILTLGLPAPANFFLLACICFYLLALALRVNPYVGMFTALAYAYSTYNPSILVVGHSTKMEAIAIMPAFLASLLWLYEKKYWLGTATLALFTSLFIAANHPQIVYYGLITAAFMTLAYLIRWVRQKDYRHIALVIALGAAAGLIGIASNAVVILTTMDYAKASLRNGSDLATAGGNITKTGLSQDYALSYSMYKTEAFTLFVPKIYGGGNFDAQMTADDSKTMTALQNMPPQIGQQLQQMVRSYWGGIGGTAGPAYAGAVICLFGLMGFFLLDGKHKWWMLAAGVLAILMSWGSYFVEFNGPLLKILPGYSKFRAPSVIIVIPTLLLCMLAALSLNRLLTLTAAESDATWKQYKKGLYLMGGIFVILFLLYMSFDYTTEGDRGFQQRITSAPAEVQEFIRSFLHALRDDRQSMFLGSIFRSLAYIAIAATIGFFWLKGKLKPFLSLGLIGTLAFIDLITTDIQYLNADKYQDEEEAQTPFQPTPADQQILTDKSYYRVFDLREGRENITNSGPTPYFHHSITGYHPAKLSIYEDIIENQLYKYPNCQPVLNMLNTKYLLLPTAGGRDSVALNKAALGPVWLVRGIRYAPDARTVMDALTDLDTRDTAILFTADQSKAADATPANTDSIWLEKNDNDEMTYHATTTAPRFAVFSEVYYNRGWHAYINNNEVPIIRTDYVLRGLSIPAGSHTIRFTFHPASYYTGTTIQIIAGIFMLALLLATAFQIIRKRSF